MRSTSALVLLASLGLPGCANEIPLPGSIKLLEALPRVENSTKAPCWQQRQIAKQNAYLASIEQKREVTYAAPCDVDRPVVASSQKPTS